MRILIVVLMSCVISIAQPLPCITFNSTYHDFGKIYNNQASHIFKVTNTGKEYLNITKLNPSCGCIATVLGKWSLAPNESTNISVTLNVTGLCNSLKRSVQVTSNDPVNPIVTLTLKADAVQEIMPSANSVFFDNLIRTFPRKTSIKLISGNGHPVHIQEIKTNGAPYIYCTHHKEGHNAIVEIAIDGRRIRSNQCRGVNTVYIHTGNKKVPLINIAVQWDVAATIIIDPTQIAITGPSGIDLYKTIKLRQINNKPFNVIYNKTTNSNFQVKNIHNISMAECELQLKVSSKTNSGIYDEKITLGLNDPDQPEVVLNIYANLK